MDQIQIRSIIQFKSISTPTVTESKFDPLCLIEAQLLIVNRIKNPLAGIPKSLLLAQVTEFAKQNDLIEIEPLLHKGALVAQNPAEFDHVEGLTDGEALALKDEIIHKWRQPTALYFTVILCSIAAAVQGWDQTGSNGANLSWPLEFGVPDSKNKDGSSPPHFEYNQWIVGLVNAGPYIG